MMENNQHVMLLQLFIQIFLLRLTKACIRIWTRENRLAKEITCWRISVNNDTSGIARIFWHQMIGFLAVGANKSVEVKTIS